MASASPGRHFLRLAGGEGIAQCDVIFGWDIAEEVIGDLPYSSWAGGFRDVLMRPDLSTFAVVPWEQGAASVICDLYTEEGDPYPVAPRQVLRRAVERAAAAGVRCKAAVEYEVRFFREDQQSLRAKDYTGLEPLSPGLNCYSIHHASIGRGRDRRDSAPAPSPTASPSRATTVSMAPGMYEINLRYGEAIAAADQAMLYKSAVKEVAAQARRHTNLHGEVLGHYRWLQRTHPPEPLGRRRAPTSSGTRGAQHHMSQTMRHFIAGVLATLPEFMLMYAPNVNSYKRFVKGTLGADHRRLGHRQPHHCACASSHLTPARPD